MTIRLALFEDRLDGTSEWSAAPRAVFVRSGRFTITDEASGSRTLVEADCQLFTADVRIEGSGELWTFELAALSAASLTPAQQSRCILAHDIDLDPSEPIVLRADRVEFPEGMVHRGMATRVPAFVGSIVAD